MIDKIIEDVSDIVAIIAAVISLLALVMAILSYRVSRRALRISEQEFAEKKLPLKEYLIDSFRFDDGERRFIAFSLRFSNVSASSRTLSTFDLEVHLADGQKIFCSPYNYILPNHLLFGQEMLGVPLNISPKTVVSGWVVFAIPRKAFGFSAIEKYKVSAKTDDNFDVSMEVFLVRYCDVKEEVKI
ncbi:hypothetical protein M0G74_12460 [Microbulbifer sp. CAU 1566]|uniref:hypothetical protein n=1 Tax=Microbulbifer sp. CAU 1566 TaxID=2933269 RepID=UPI002004A8A9|nr:hypothetical protein [Microbulbifer sp. CAU 1566]MCK7598086.1 hypothetical protein [Microbulbifer sp. CAU 1566]